MAKCEYCNGEMQTVKTCKFPYVLINNKIYKRRTDELGDYQNEKCHDCGIVLDVENHFHHFGCDAEYCPNCGEQFAFCECEKILGVNKETLIKELTK